MSYHMTRVRDYFSSYKEENTNIQISMVNFSKLNLVGKEIIYYEKIILVHNVLHVPGLGMNFIFVSIL